MDRMLSEVEETKYVIKVRGQVVSVPFNTRSVAEQNIGNLPMDQQMIAEVVAVTSDGKEILFG